MKIVSQIRSISLAALSGLILIPLIPAHADSWGPSSEFDGLSKNRWFVGHVVPATTNAKPYLVVYSLTGGERQQRWRSQLSNRVAPTRVFVSDDGEAVVTTDNYF